MKSDDWHFCTFWHFLTFMIIFSFQNMKPRSYSASLKILCVQHTQQLKLAKVSHCFEKFQDASDDMRFTTLTHALHRRTVQNMS